jgi:hypothetical protein
MGETRNSYRILAEKPLGNVHSEDRREGRMTLRWILERYIMRTGDGWI